MMQKRPPFSSLRTSSLERMEDKVLRNLIHKARKEKSIPWHVVEKKLERIEDRLDAEDARKAMKEPAIPWEQVKRDLGL